LIGTAEFRAAISAKPPTPQDVLLNEKQSMIALLGSGKAAKHPIADEVGSVVTLTTGSGSGSGVLLSSDGYILTNAHVVGDEKEVRVRWSDGIEKTGQVIRVSKPRDVAVIKTDPRDREPLPILRGALSPGQRVFAIGSPRGKDFQGTVSSGVVSASRTIEGMRYIQSDVSISPGSSGGALLDENGSLLGITVATFQNGGQNAGLNIFIPIGDAMDFLSLEQN
jgi:S1-C subfamily serine protease